MLVFYQKFKGQACHTIHIFEWFIDNMEIGNIYLYTTAPPDHISACKWDKYYNTREFDQKRHQFLKV